MPDPAEEATTGARSFGLTPNLVRGIVAVLVIALGLYAILFESEPPPIFEDVEINIPERPETDFDERSIVLPDFKQSPAEEDVEPAEGVVISPPQVEEAPQPEPANQQAVDAIEQGASEKPVTEEAASSQESEPQVVEGEEVTPLQAAESGYFVQVAALTSGEAAEELATQIGTTLGEPHYVQQVQQGEQLLFRVRLGPFADEAQARTTLTRLRELDPNVSKNSYVDLE